MRILKTMILFMLFGVLASAYAQAEIKGSVLVKPFENKTKYLKVTDGMDNKMRDALISNAKLKAMCLEDKTQQLQTDYALESSLISYDGFLPYSFIINFRLKEIATGRIVFDELIDVDMGRSKDRRRYARGSKTMTALLEKAFESFVIDMFTDEEDRVSFPFDQFKRWWPKNK